MAVPRRAARLSRLPLGIASLLAFVLTCQDVTVTPVAVRNVEIDPGNVTLAVGEERKLTAIVTDDSGNRLTDRAVTWSTEHENIVSVDAETGDVVALSSGEASVTAAVDGRSGTAMIHVMDAPDEEVARVEVDPDTTSIGVGQTVTLEVIARSEGGAVLSGREVSWSSDDEDVATVDDEGVVTGKSPGDVTITAMIDDVKGTASVTVTEVVEPVATVEVEPTDTSIVVGDTVALKAVARSEDGTELGGREVSWSSNDEDVATVDAEGVVTGLAEGDATITATIEGVSDGAEVTVSLLTVDSVAIQPPELSMLVDDTVRLVAVALTANGDTLTDRVVSWESADPDIVTVDDQGLVTGIAEGDVQITATVDDVSATAQVTVSLVPVESVEVVPAETSVFVGDTVRLTAIALAANGDTLSSRVATWTSEDDDIATVDGGGLVTGVAEGNRRFVRTRHLLQPRRYAP